jgi:hypothetical protein
VGKDDRVAPRSRHTEKRGHARNSETPERAERARKLDGSEAVFTIASHQEVLGIEHSSELRQWRVGEGETTSDLKIPAKRARIRGRFEGSSRDRRRDVGIG